MEGAAARRLGEELAVKSDLRFLFRFQYQAGFGAEGSENELCSVYIGRLAGPPVPNSAEIEEMKFIGVSELTADLKNNPVRYTPWLRMEWERMIRDFPDQVCND